MGWQNSVFEVIDLRSFSNLWYWIGLAVLWSSVSHWVIGVPYDAILRAKRGKPEGAVDDLHALTRVHVNRVLYIADVSGTWIALISSALLTALGITAFLYGIEFCQALFFLAAPMPLIGAMSIWTARKIQSRELVGVPLIRMLLRHRFVTQLIGVITIFITAMYGMYMNFYTGPFVN